MSARKTQRLSFPNLEKQLKKTRMMSTMFAEEAIDDVRSTCDSEMFKGSCLEDALEFSIIKNPEVYESWDLALGGKSILLRAVFGLGIISDHFHDHQESLMIENGSARFMIKGVSIDLIAGSRVGIPPRAFHECEFMEKTVAIVCMPEKVFKDLSFPA